MAKVVTTGDPGEYPFVMARWEAAQSSSSLIELEMNHSDGLIAGRDYMIFWSCEVSINSTTDKIQVLSVSGGFRSLILTEQMTASNTAWHPIAGFYIRTHQTSRTYDINITGDGTSQKNIRRATIIAFPLNDLVDGTDYFFNNSLVPDTLVNMGSSYPSNIALSRTFTPSEQEDFVVFAFADLSPDSGNRWVGAQVSLDDEASTWDTSFHEGEDSNESHNYFSVNVVNLTAASHKIELQGASEASRGDVDRCALFIIRAAAFNEIKSELESGAETQNSSTPTQKDRLSFTPSTAGNYLVVSRVSRRVDSNTLGTYDQRVQLDDSTSDETMGTTLLGFDLPNRDTDYYSCASLLIHDLDGSAHTIDLDYGRNTGGQNEASDSAIVAISMVKPGDVGENVAVGVATIATSAPTLSFSFGAITKSVGVASAAFSVPVLTVVPPPQTTVVGVASVVTSAPAATPSVGAISVTLGVATVVTSGVDVAAILGPVTILTGVASATFSAPAVSVSSAATEIPVGVASASFSAPAATVDKTLAVSVGVASASFSAPGANVIVESITLSVGVASASFSAPIASVVSGALDIPVGIASAAFSAPPVIVDQGVITIEVGVASAAFSTFAVVASPGTLFLSVGVASASFSAPIASVVSGDLDIPLGVASATSSAPAATVSLGAITSSVGVASAVTSAPSASITLGLTLILGVASSVASAPSISIVVTVPLGVASAVTSAPTLTVNQTIFPSVASASFSAPAVSLAFGGITTSLDVAVILTNVPFVTVDAGVTVVFQQYGEDTYLLDPNDYTPETEFFFEAMMSTGNAAEPIFVRLINITDGLMAVEISSTSITTERVRSAVLSLPSAPKEYRVDVGGLIGGSFICSSAKIRGDSD